MDKKSAILVSGGLVLALVAGTVSREVSLKSVAAATPVRVVVQTAAPAATTTANYEQGDM